MILPGHLAVAIFVHELLHVDLPTVIAATVVPDAVDKGLAQGLHVTPSGRYAMHSLVGWLASSLLVGLVGGKERGYAWAIGHLFHLLGDPGHVPWWFPFRKYEFCEIMELDQFLYSIFATTEARRKLLAEMLLLVLALVSLRWDSGRQARNIGPRARLCVRKEEADACQNCPDLPGG